MELLTDHARARMQQRGIRPEMLEALLDYGREVHVPGGRDLVFFDKRARARLAKAGMTFTDAHSGSSVCTPHFSVWRSRSRGDSEIGPRRVERSRCSGWSCTRGRLPYATVCHC